MLIKGDVDDGRAEKVYAHIASGLLQHLTTHRTTAARKSDQTKE